jgi:hypothetical protein
MTVIKSADVERFERIERTLRRLQDEVEALRDQMRGTAEAARERAPKHRVTGTKEQVGPNVSREMELSQAASGRARQAQTAADAAGERASEISRSSARRTKRK